jgi:glycosyltransferase involved in cell wall biosynthesis
MSTSCKGLRVMLVGTYPPPFGGIATHLISLVPGLKERGAEDIAIVSIGGDENIQTVPGAIIYRVSIKNHMRTLLNPNNWVLLAISIGVFLRYRMKFSSIIRESIKAILINKFVQKHRSEVVNFYHSNAHLELVPLSIYWRGKRGISMAVFGEVYGSPEFLLNSHELIKRELNIPTIVWASSDHCANSFKKIGIERVIRTVYYGVELEHDTKEDIRDIFRKEHCISSNSTVLLFTGRFIKDMGLDVILNLIPDLLNNYGHVNFILAGAKGDFSEKAEKLAERFPGRIHIFQNFPFSMQAALFSSCDIVLAPSYDQRACMGLSIKEAMSFKKPVIATNCGGIPEAVVHGETGFLVPLDEISKSADQQKFIEAIRMLIDDADLCKKMGEAGFIRAKKLFAIEGTINAVAGLLMETRTKK